MLRASDTRRARGKACTAAGMLALAAALVSACGDDDEPRRRPAPRDAGRDARPSDASADAADPPDTSHDSGVDGAGSDANSPDANDAGAADAREAAAESGADAAADDAATDSPGIAPGLDAGADASSTADAATSADAALETGVDAGVDAPESADSAPADSASDAASTLDASNAPLVFWQVGPGFVCQGERTQVECSDDDFAEAYVITILQSGGSACTQGPSRITAYFPYGSPPAAGEYTVSALQSGEPRAARLDVDIGNGAQTWVAQGGALTVESVGGVPSLSFTDVPARFGVADATLSGRVTCPPDN